MEKVELLMTIAPVATAIRHHGQGGGRIQLDFDDTQTAKVIKLLGMRDKVIRITAEEAEDY